MKILTMAWAIYDDSLKEFENNCTGGGLIIKNLCEELGKSNESYLFIGQFTLPEIKLGNIKIINTRRFAEFYKDVTNSDVRRIRIMTHAFSQVLSELNPDIVNIHGIGELAIACIRMCIEKKIPVVYTEHLFLSKFEFFNYNNKVIEWEKELYRIEELQIIAVSNGMKKKILKEYPQLKEANVRVILNGTDFVANVTGSDLREKLKIKNKKVLICSGNISERKNQIFLVETFSKMITDVQREVVIIFLGKDRIQGKLQKKIEEKHLSDKFIYIGAVSSEEMKQYYSIADGLIMPSYAEGLSIAALEIISYGKPVIMFSDSECAEDLNDSKVVVLAKERTSECLAKSIEEWYSKEWDFKYIKNFSKYFTMERVAEDYLMYYQYIISKKDK